MAQRGLTGGSMGGRVEMSPARRKRLAAKRRSEEKYWASKASKVEVRKIEPKGSQESGEQDEGA